MTHRESKAISDRINRKSIRNEYLESLTAKITLGELILMHAKSKLNAANFAAQTAYYAKAIKKRRMEAKKLTGSGDDRLTTYIASAQAGSETSPAMDGIRPDGGDGRRRACDRA